MCSSFQEHYSTTANQTPCSLTYILTTYIPSTARSSRPLGSAPNLHCLVGMRFNKILKTTLTVHSGPPFAPTLVCALYNVGTGPCAGGFGYIPRPRGSSTRIARG